MSELLNSWESWVWEDFNHWPTPAELKESAELGCHLCTLIWHTLSYEQQNELLKLDATLANELEDELRIVAIEDDDDEKQRNETRLKYYQKRSIRIRIEPLWHYSKTAIVHEGDVVHEGDGVPMGSWTPQPNKPRLIPHFGGFRIAQRWLPQRTASRSISMGIDPATEWHREQAEGIPIVEAPVRSGDRGK